MVVVGFGRGEFGDYEVDCCTAPLQEPLRVNVAADGITACPAARRI